MGAARGVADDARPVEPLPASGRFELSSAASSQRAVSSRAAVNGGSKSTFDTPLATAMANARTKTAGQSVLLKTKPKPAQSWRLLYSPLVVGRSLVVEESSYFPRKRRLQKPVTLHLQSLVFQCQRPVERLDTPVSSLNHRRRSAAPHSQSKERP